MKIEDFNKVEFLVSMMLALDKAIVECNEMPDGEEDVGGIEGFNMGFNGHFSMWQDGSGPSIDLCGLYVQDQVVDSIRNILENQRQDVRDALTNLGVEL